MKPDSTFVKELKSISKELDVEWDKDQCRWIIYYKSPILGRQRVLEVHNEDDSYRPLDRRTLDTLRRCDMSRYSGDPGYYFSEQYKKAKEYKQRIREQNRQRILDKARDMPKKKFLDATENALKGIWGPRQLENRTKYFLPISTPKLLRKLGKPFLPGIPLNINP